MKAKDSVYSDAITALSKNEPPKECGYLEFKREMGSDKKYSNENMPRIVILQRNFPQKY